MTCAAGLISAAQVFGQAYQEAPMLAERVARGELPPVSERLPENPVVVEPVHSIGQYGGTWRRLAKAPGDTGLNSRLGYEALLRWDRQGERVIPGIAESWEMNEDATEFTFHLRRGMRWSDGHPFTSEDYIFTYEYVDRYEQLAPSPASWKTIDGKLYELTAPDPYTLVYRFDKPYGMFPEILAYRGLTRATCLPKHYMSQFHPDFVDAAQLAADARSKGFVDWRGYFNDMSDLDKNPACPTVNAFICAVPFPEPRCLAVRNPYYWKVDPQGNQLPYIDEISYTTVFDSNVLNMKAMDGEVDYQTRHINAGNYTLFMESRDKAADPVNHYRVHIEQSTAVTAVYVNQHSKDDTLRPILQDRRFRIALSAAINREELIDMCYSGMAEPNNGVTTPFDPFYADGMDKQHIEYDPELANRLLDEIGLTRDESNGVRRLPNGEVFHQILHVYPSESGDTGDLWLLVAEYWREVGLSFVVKHEDGTLSGMQVRNGNSDFWAYSSAGMHWELDGLWMAPLASNSYYAPLYGRYYQSQGRAGVKPPPEHQILVDWYLELKSTPSYTRRTELAQRILRYWSDKCYLIGICRKPEVFIISDRFRNVPESIIQDWTLMAPGYIGIEQFWIDQSADGPLVRRGSR